MQGLVNFANDIGAGILAALPVICLIAGLSAIGGGAWMLYQTSRPGTYGRGKPFAWWCLMMVGFALLGLPEFLNAGTNTLGGTRMMRASESMNAYAPIDLANTGWTGLSPNQTFLAVINSFIWFFVAVGASFVVRGLTGLGSHFKGTSRAGWFPFVLMIACGIVIVNIDTIAASLIASTQRGT